MARDLKQDVLKQFKSVFYYFKTIFFVLKHWHDKIMQYVFLFSNQPLIFIANLYYNNKLLNVLKHFLKHFKKYKKRFKTCFLPSLLSRHS